MGNKKQPAIVKLTEQQLEQIYDALNVHKKVWIPKLGVFYVTFVNPQKTYDAYRRDYISPKSFNKISLKPARGLKRFIN